MSQWTFFSHTFLHTTDYLTGNRISLFLPHLPSMLLAIPMHNDSLIQFESYSNSTGQLIPLEWRLGFAGIYTIWPSATNRKDFSNIYVFSNLSRKERILSGELEHLFRNLFLIFLFVVGSFWNSIVSIRKRIICSTLWATEKNLVGL